MVQSVISVIIVSLVLFLLRTNLQSNKFIPRAIRCAITWGVCVRAMFVIRTKTFNRSRMRKHNILEPNDNKSYWYFTTESMRVSDACICQCVTFPNDIGFWHKQYEIDWARFTNDFLCAQLQTKLRFENVSPALIWIHWTFDWKNLANWFKVSTGQALRKLFFLVLFVFAQSVDWLVIIQLDDFVDVDCSALCRIQSRQKVSSHLLAIYIPPHAHGNQTLTKVSPLLHSTPSHAIRKEFGNLSQNSSTYCQLM